MAISPQAQTISPQAQIIVTAVWSFCIRETRGATTKDLAKECGRSVSWIHKHWHDAAGHTTMTFTDVYVDRKDKNYGVPLCPQRVDALQPTWVALAKHIKSNSDG